MEMVLERIEKEYTESQETWSDKDLTDYANRILAEENVNAVEITDISGSGVVVYKDWP